MASAQKSAESKTGAKKKRGPRTVHVLKPKLTNDSIIHMGRQLAKRKASIEAMKALTLVKAEPLPVIKGFVVVPDVKTASSPALPTSEGVAALQQLYDSELKFARGAIGQMFGMKPIPFNLPTPANFVSTVTTGVVSATFPMDASQATEWSSLAALFDEYKFVGGVYHFWVNSPTLISTMGTSGNIGADSVLFLGFDPSDNTAASSTGNIAMLEQHKGYYPRPIATSASPTANTYAGVFNCVNGKPLVFEWKVGCAAEFTGNGGAVGPGQWKATAGNVSSFPDGTIKPYWASGNALATTVINGMFYWHIHFRMRT
jgi:hypothetical protein